MDIRTRKKLLKTRTRELTEFSEDEQAKSNAALQNEITDGIMYSNQYALFFAGQVGLAMIGKEADKDVRNGVYLGADTATSTDIDTMARSLVTRNVEELDTMLSKVRQEFTAVEDTNLADSLRTIFSSWVNQYNPATFQDVVKEYGLEGMTVRFGDYSAKDGQFKHRESRIIVDEKLMNIRPKDVIGNQDFQDKIKNIFLQSVQSTNDRIHVRSAGLWKDVHGPRVYAVACRTGRGAWETAPVAAAQHHRLRDQVPERDARAAQPSRTRYPSVRWPDSYVRGRRGHDLQVTQ
jgi:hypothetical protein